MIQTPSHIETVPAPRIYVPAGCTTLDQSVDRQIRLGIQGYPFTGKTTSALTFPNPVILSVDRKTNAHAHRTDVINIPFYDPVFVDKIVKRDGAKAPPNRKDAILVWLATEGMKLTEDQTLIADGCSGIEVAYHSWFKQNEHLAISKTGNRNEFIEWSLKKDFFEDIFTAIKALSCNVIFISHETRDRGKDGEINGKTRPLLTGQAGDRMGGNFTDWFRSMTINKPENDDQLKKFKTFLDLTDEQAKEWITSTPKDHKAIYYWQTQSDSTCDCGSSSLRGAPKYILASYSSFQKYRK